MSLVILGATGQLGRLVVEKLLAGGQAPEEIVAAGRRTDRLADLAERGVRIATVDMDRLETLEAVISAGDTVLLISGSEVGRRVAQHGNVVAVAASAGAARLVYTSAPHADTTTLILAPEHKATEEILRRSGVPFTILRNGWYTENYVPEVAPAVATGELISSVGDGRVASASRADYAAAAAAVLVAPGLQGHTYELSGDVAWDFDDLAAAITKVTGAPVSYRRVSPEERLAGLLAVGLDEGTAGFVVALEGDTRAGLLAETSGDLARLIGRPTTPLVDGLTAALA